MDKKIQATFEGIGWKFRLQKKKTSHALTLVHELVIGNALKCGDELYYYLVNCEGRKALLIFLDGKERMHQDKIVLEQARSN